MKEIEDKENEEFKERIKKLLDRIEKTENNSILLRAEQDVKDLNEKLIEKTRDKYSQYIEQDLLEDKGGLLDTIKIRTQEDKFRNESIIAILTYWIKGYYEQRTKKEQFKEEISELYGLIEEQFKKPSSHISQEIPVNPNLEIFYLDSKGLNPEEKADRMRILEKIMWFLGVKNVDQDFVKKFKDLDFGFERVSFKSLKKELIQLILIVIFGIVVIILAINGYDGIIG